MLVDSGFFLADERNAHSKLRPDIVTKNDWVLKAIQQFPVDVVNVSSHDLRYFIDATKTDFLRRPEAKSLLARLVSTNTSVDPHGSQPFSRYVVRELPSRQNGAKPVRVAFIGLTETNPPPPDGVNFTDPAEAAKRVLPEARKSADVVVVLAKVNSAEAARIAREAPGIDIIIAGNSESVNESFTPPYRAGQTLIVFTPFETRMLGELRFYRSAEGKFSTKQRFIALDELLVPEDAAAKQLVDAAATAERDTRDNSKKLLEDWLESSRMRVKADPNSSGGESAPAYVSGSACGQCHASQYIKWANSPHAHATDPLPPRANEFDGSCLYCHATGSKRGTPSTKPEIARLQSVQCEQCHGPGSNHVAKPGKGYGKIANIQSLCASCHTVAISPSFDLQTAWAAIKH